MNFKCLLEMQSQLERAVGSIVEDGTTRTEDGHWCVLMDDLDEKYDIADPFSQNLVLKMLCEREEVNYAEQIGDEYFVAFSLEHCTFHQCQLFDAGRTKATGVYTVEMKDAAPQNFYTECAGGYSMVNRVTELLIIARKGLSPQISDTELMPLLVSDYYFTGDEQRLFAAITEEEAKQLLAAEDGQTAFHITLNMESGTVRIKPIPASGECALPELTLMIHGRTVSLDYLQHISACSEYAEEGFRQAIFRDLQQFKAQSEALMPSAPSQGMQLL